MIGTVLSNRYKMIAELGSGGMAWVYLAEDMLEGTKVAVKILYPQHAKDLLFVQRFRREAQLSMALSATSPQPNVVCVLDYGSDRDTHYLVMEYVPGQDLGQLLERRGPLPWQDALRLARQVALALDHAHQLDIVHRDIKPSNIMVLPDGTARVLDFGIARAQTSPSLTLAGFVGSPHYAAPEQARGEAVDIRADIYSLGIVLYRMLSGDLPFQGDTPWVVINRHVAGAAPPLAEACPELPGAVIDLAETAMARRPEDRYQTPDEMVQAIEALLPGREHIPQPLPVAPPAAVIDLAELQERAQQAAHDERWQEAVDLYSQILRVDSGYPGVAEQLEAVGQRVGLATLYRSVQRTLEIGQWAQALRQLDKIAAVDPEYKDIGALRLRAERKEAGPGDGPAPSPEFPTQIPSTAREPEPLVTDPAPAPAPAPEPAPPASPPPHPSSRPPRRRLLLVGIPILVLLLIVVAYAVFSAVGQPTPTPAALAGPSPTLTALSRLSPSVVAAVTARPTATPTSTPPAPTSTSAAPQVTPTATRTASPTSARLPRRSPTPLPTETPTPTNTASPAPTKTTLSGQIAFPRFDPDRGTYDIYACTVNGQDCHLVYAYASQPDFAPDGNHLVVHSWKPDDKGLLLVSDTGERIWRITGEVEAARPSVDFNASLYVYHSRAESDRQPRLYRTYGADTGPILRESSTVLGQSPSWLPDGRILYSGCWQDDCGIILTRADGTYPQQVVAGTNEANPEASPGGKRITYMSRRDGNWEVYVASIDGGAPQRLTNNPANDGLPTWSPDGKAIAFVTDRDGKWAVWVMRPDGTAQRRLFDIGGPLDGRVRDAALHESHGWVEERISWAP